MPSFSIEAEGETNPLTVHDIFRVLSQISTGSNQALQVSAKQLENWERTPGYYSLLQDIYSDFTIDDTVRLQAIIQLKNGIDKHWRKTSTQPIQKPEKVKIRTKAIEIGVNEPRSSLALQNALMLAKIVRFEFPHDWPDVIIVLIEQLRGAVAQSRIPSPSTKQQVKPSHDSTTNESVFVPNVIQLVLQVIKELSSGRLVRTKRSLETVAPELLVVLGELYKNLIESWMRDGDLDRMKTSHAALKVLRRLMVMGFEHPHRDSQMKPWWDLLQIHNQYCYQVWSDNVMAGSKMSEIASSLIAKHLFQFSKLWLEMARTHPASFVLLGCMDILDRSWTVVSGNHAKVALGNSDWSVKRSGDRGDDEVSAIEKLALKALLLFRACIKMVFYPVTTFKYQHPEDKEDRQSAIAQIKAQVFTDAFIVGLMEILVTEYFVLRPSDLRDWEEEPDEWERREEEIVDAWEFSVRSCSEKLFLDLVINFKELLVVRLLQVFEQYANIQNHEVLLKDGLYSAVGTAAACLEDRLDFNGFIRNTLVPEVQMSLPNYNLLRRRTAIVLGQWVPIKPDSLDRPAIYQIFAHLLNPNDKLNDHVVRVTAGRQLRLVLEPFEFDYRDFEPYALSIMNQLMSLINETELSETKMALLETVRVAVTKLEGHVEPYAQGIMSVLPELWTESGEEHLMKQAILTMITAIINSLGPRGTLYHTPILPLIHDSVQPESEAIVYLLEEALELWAAILAQSPSEGHSTELIRLAADLLPLLELGSEHLRQTFELVESYAVLSLPTILHPSILSPLIDSQRNMLPLLASSRARDASLAPHVLETIISTITLPDLLSPSQQHEALQHLTQTLLGTGYLSSALEMLYAAYQYHLNPQPNRKTPDILGIGETTLFTLLSNLCLANPQMFLDAINTVEILSTTSPDHSSEQSMHQNNISWLIPHQLLTLDSCPDTPRRKTQILALTSLTSLPITHPLILTHHLQNYLTAWTSLLLELADSTPLDSPSRGDYLFSPPIPDLHPSNPNRDPDLNLPSDPPESTRKRRILNTQPCYTINARDYIAAHLAELIRLAGGKASFETLLAHCDQLVIEEFVGCGLVI